MQSELPKRNHEYKSILKDSWGIDIDKDEIVGTYSPSKNGTQGFFSNCTTIEGAKLRYPDEKHQLFALRDVPQDIPKRDNQDFQSE
jgi:hypothetical protein